MYLGALANQICGPNNMSEGANTYSRYDKAKFWFGEVEVARLLAVSEPLCTCEGARDP